MYVAQHARKLEHNCLAGVTLSLPANQLFTSADIGLPFCCIQMMARDGIILNTGKSIRYKNYEGRTSYAKLWQTTKKHSDIVDYWRKKPLLLDNLQKFISPILMLFKTNEVMHVEEIASELGVSPIQISDSLDWLRRNNELIEIDDNMWTPRMRYIRKGWF